MARLVLDASATLTWCFEDEAMPWTDALLANLRAGDEAIVPLHWPGEVANALLIAVRRGRISHEKANRFLVDLRALPIRLDPESSDAVFDQVFKLAEQYRLTIYDAGYLELAIREGLPLATLDNDLRKAARAAAVPLVEPQP
ncbi:MAG: type II toxin-antitoxin system VapC family toxin [Terriglobia bacterium]|jgi:predicted nucleic acid-binding protein